MNGGGEVGNGEAGPASVPNMLRAVHQTVQYRSKGWRCRGPLERRHLGKHGGGLLAESGHKGRRLTEDARRCYGCRDLHRGSEAVGVVCISVCDSRAMLLSTGGALGTEVNMTNPG